MVISYGELQLSFTLRRLALFKKASPADKFSKEQICFMTCHFLFCGKPTVRMLMLVGAGFYGPLLVFSYYCCLPA